MPTPVHPLLVLICYRSCESVAIQQQCLWCWHSLSGVCRVGNDFPSIVFWDPFGGIPPCADTDVAVKHFPSSTSMLHTLAVVSWCLTIYACMKSTFLLCWGAFLTLFILCSVRCWHQWHRPVTSTIAVEAGMVAPDAIDGPLFGYV